MLAVLKSLQKIAPLPTILYVVRCNGLMQLTASDQYKIQKPCLVNLPQIDFLRMLLNEGDDLLFPKAVDVMAIAVVPMGSLEAVRGRRYTDRSAGETPALQLAPMG